MTAHWRVCAGWLLGDKALMVWSIQNGGETMPTDVNFMVGGEAGQGVQSVGFILAKASLAAIVPIVRSAAIAVNLTPTGNVPAISIKLPTCWEIENAHQTILVYYSIIFSP